MVVARLAVAARVVVPVAVARFNRRVRAARRQVDGRDVRDCVGASHHVKLGVRAARHVGCAVVGFPSVHASDWGGAKARHALLPAADRSQRPVTPSDE